MPSIINDSETQIKAKTWTRWNGRTEKSKNEKYYDRSAKQKEKIECDDEIIIRNPGETMWSEGKVKQETRERSYKVEVDVKNYIRNRIDIKPVVKRSKEVEKEER